MSGHTPEERVRRPFLKQRWSRVTFLHWRYDPAVLRSLVPPDLEIEVIDGSAWLSLIPFAMEGSHLTGWRPLGLTSDFPETNLRTYVITPGGLDAVLFFSLDAGSPTTLVARSLFGLPYVWSRMSASGGDGHMSYRSRRRGRVHASLRLSVTVGEPMGSAASQLDHALTGRWRAAARFGGRRAVVPVQHQPWQLHRVGVVELEETILRAAGVPPPASDPLVHYAPGVDAAFGVPRLLTSQSETPPPGLA